MLSRRHKIIGCITAAALAGGLMAVEQGATPAFAGSLASNTVAQRQPALPTALKPFTSLAVTKDTPPALKPLLSDVAALRALDQRFSSASSPAESKAVLGEATPLAGRIRTELGRLNPSTSASPSAAPANFGFPTFDFRAFVCPVLFALDPLFNGQFAFIIDAPQAVFHCGATPSGI